MKLKSLLSLPIFILCFSQVKSQCNNSLQYPSTTYVPTTTYAAINPCNFGGEHALVSVIAGNTYYFSTQTSSGTNITYDSQLTLRDNSFNYIDYNDDAPDGGLGALIIWEATYTGIVQIHLNVFNCGSNNTCSFIMVKFETPIGILTHEVTNESLFNIFPSNNYGTYHLEFVENESSNNWISIYSLTGELVTEINTRDKKINLDLSNQANGVYIVNVINEKGQKSSRKIVLVN